jgi:hypothetical protein
MGRCRPFRRLKASRMMWVTTPATAGHADIDVTRWTCRHGRDDIEGT